MAKPRTTSSDLSVLAPDVYDMNRNRISRGDSELVESPNFTWLNDPTPARTLMATVRRLILDQNYRLTLNTRYSSLYANRDLLSQRGTYGASPSAASAMPRQTLNLIKVYTDTLVGKLIESNSRVEINSIDGDWETFRLSRHLGHMLDATFQKSRLYREMSKVAIDAVTVGNGYLYVGEEDGEVCYQRWYFNELFVDQLDAIYGCPSMLFRIRYMYPDNALGEFGKTPEQREAIIKAPRAMPPSFNWAPYESGMIEIFEAWGLELPHRKGRHVISTGYGTLLDEPYKRSVFPVVNFRVGDLPLGWYGQGMTAHSGGTQVMLNRVLDIMARGAHLGIAPFWVVSGGADIAVKQIRNVEGNIITSNGPPPQWVTNKPFHEAAPAYAQYLQSIIRMVYGISEIESTGAMPLNRLDSNPALIQAKDMWMARHAVLLRSYSDDVFLDVAERTVDVSSDIAKRRGSYPVVVNKQGRTWGMDWKDFQSLDKNKYRMVPQASSAVALTPPARRKMLLDMAAAGTLPQDRALELVLGAGDLEVATAQVSAFQSNADWICEAIIDGKKNVMAKLSQFQKFDVLYDRIRTAALQAQEHDAPDDVLQEFELVGAAVRDKMQQEQAEMMMQQQALMGPPGGAPPAPGPPSPVPQLPPSPTP